VYSSLIVGFWKSGFDIPKLLFYIQDHLIRWWNIFKFLETSGVIKIKPSIIQVNIQFIYFLLQSFPCFFKLICKLLCNFNVFVPIIIKILLRVRSLYPYFHLLVHRRYILIDSCGDLSEPLDLFTWSTQNFYQFPCIYLDVCYFMLPWHQFIS
jgi:hypothetical protein